RLKEFDRGPRRIVGLEQIGIGAALQQLIGPAHNTVLAAVSGLFADADRIIERVALGERMRRKIEFEGGPPVEDRAGHRAQARDEAAFEQDPLRRRERQLAEILVWSARLVEGYVKWLGG